MQSLKKGFTLIELLIAITIIGILSATLIPRVVNIVPQARDSARVAALNDFIAAIEAYNLDQGSYPTQAFCLGESADTLNDDGYTVDDFVADYMRGTPPEFKAVTGNSIDCATSLYYDAPDNLDEPIYAYAVATAVELEKSGNYGGKNTKIDSDIGELVDGEGQYFVIIR